MRLARCVAANATDTSRPSALLEHAEEVVRVGAVDHIVGRRPVGRVIDLLDRLPERLTARQAAVGFGRKGDDGGQAESGGARAKPAASSAWVKVIAVTMSTSVSRASRAAARDKLPPHRSQPWHWERRRRRADRRRH